MAQISPNPQHSGIGLISSAQVSETQPTLLPLQITVHRAHNLPRLKTLVGKKRQFYVTFTYGETAKRTRSVRSVAQRVEWNETVDAFAVQPLSRITVSLHAVKTTKKSDILIGREEITCEPRCEFEIAFRNADGRATHTVEQTRLFLTVSVSTNASPAQPTVQSNNESMQLTTVTAPLSQTGDIPIEGDSHVGRVEDSQTKLSRALDSAEEAMDTMKTWKVAIDVVKQVMDHVGPIVKLLPHAMPAWDLLSMIPQNLQQQFQRDDNVQTLLEAIRDSFEIVKDADVLKNLEPASMQVKILDEMLECVSECAKFIISYAADVQVAKRTLKNIIGQVDGKIEQYRSNLFRLRNNFLARAAVITEVAVLEAELDAKIRELPHKGGWRFGDEKRCLPGTRKDFLDFIFKWVENPNSNRGLVLLGQAGTGKSSIAHEVARHFDDKCLGSYFTFLRKEGSKADAYQLFTTLARDLCDRHRAFKRALGTVVRDNSSLRGSRDYRTLFERLLVEPLRDLPLAGPILIVIDGLDESGDAIGKTGLHKFLADHLGDLPSNFRVLVTSRSEDGVEHVFSKASSVDTIYMNDAKLALQTEQDIAMYLQKELPPDVYKDHGVKLATAAEGLFQWVAVACGFINSRASIGLSMKKRVERLLGHSRGRRGEGLLDVLYEEVLKEYFETEEARTLFRTVMGQLLAAVEPLSIESLISLQRHSPVDDDPEDFDPVSVLEILGHLGSLLTNVTSSDQTRPIIPLHTSFRDFLTDKTSNVFYVDLGEAHHQLAHSCLSLMLNDLKFNICNLESSYLANSDVPDLDYRVAKHIPRALSYACVFWGDHLENVVFEGDLFSKLESLFETKFLFWLEVLSLTSTVRHVLPALSSLLKLLQREHTQTEITNMLALVKDATTFVRYFGMAMARSAPHIYVSALPFAPSFSRIVDQYLRQFPRTVSLERGRLPHWPTLEMTIEGHGDGMVISVAFSPDGQRIASAWDDHTVRVWDATTGELVVGPFIGHTDWVSSVAFSPDGQRIASASGDYTVRVWDAATGEVLAGPFTGHTDPVFSVAFSPDGKRIASASMDCTIRVWDASTGEVMAGPFTGHTGLIYAVAFSPDGQHIASASHDHTVRVWDAATGEVLVGPFTGHTSVVFSVSFSPDGRRIASASMDRTIRVWDAATGEVVAGPFTGHTSLIQSVAFSPDGQYIASGATDHTIRVWDAATGEVVGGPYTGHTDRVISVSFSPDGQRIASASNDQTIRVWCAAIGEVTAGRFTGHTTWVYSVAFLPDGQRIASGANDGTIRVWDATTGDVVAGPFTGHSGLIYSISVSPDGQRIASASSDCTIRIWDVTTGEVATSPFIGHTQHAVSVTFSPDGQRIASSSYDHTIRVWDAATGEVIAGPFTGHTSLVKSVAFSPDGQRIASGSYDNTIRMWDSTTGEVVVGPITGHADPVVSVAFSPDGQRIASASKDQTIRVWDATTGEVVAGPFTGHADSVESIAFSPEGDRIASASLDHTIRVWNAATGEVVAGPFTGHTDPVFCVAFSPCGQYTVSGSSGGVIRVEKVTTEQIENTHFTDQSLIDGDGWIRGGDGELFLWIPTLHRPCLHRPSTVWTVGKQDTRLNFSKFAHGSNWATVYDNDLSK